MVNKKILVALSFAAVSAMSASLLVFNNFNEILSSVADSNPTGTYTLKIDGSNPFVIGDDPIATLETTTKNGNPVVFEGMNILYRENCLCVIPKDATGAYSNFIKNRTPIDGMIGFKVMFADEDINDSLFVEWVKDSTG